jgi:hypothetical protein
MSNASMSLSLLNAYFMFTFVSYAFNVSVIIRIIIKCSFYVYICVLMLQG